jgi:fused signal recognition particle receptor
MFGFLKQQISKAYNTFSSLRNLFSRPQVDDALLKELEIQLVVADAGIKVARAVVEKVKTSHPQSAQEFKRIVSQELLHILTPSENYGINEEPSRVYLLVGINGAGKTTVAGKLAHLLQGKTLLVGADTFRAAAGEQLKIWADRTHSDSIVGTPGQDPASVVHQACERFKSENYDTLIIDTAGRLQTKAPLMKELEKIRRTISKLLPEEKVTTLLTVDAVLGQNSLDQAKLFNEATKLDGIVLTKMDGTSRGGMIFAISHEIKIPVAYISYGEAQDAFAPFEPQKFIDELLE